MFKAYIIYMKATVQETKMTNPSDRLLVNLNVVGALQPHQRINAKQELLSVEPQTWLPEFVYRWWRADDRQTCMRRLNEILDKTRNQVTIAMQTKHSGDKRVAEKFLCHVYGARPGLRNLKQTYATDATAVAHIDLLIEMCDEMIRTYNYNPPRLVVMDEMPESSDSNSSPSNTDSE